MSGHVDDVFAFEFNSAEAAVELLKASKDMDAVYLGLEGNDLGMWFLDLADQLYKRRRDPQDILFVGKKALDVLLRDVSSIVPCCFAEDTGLSPKHSHQASFFVACTLNLLGYACSELKRYEVSLKYLNWSNKNLSKLEEEKDAGTSCCARNCVCEISVRNEEILYAVRVAMGKKEEAVVHKKRILELKERSGEEVSLDMAEACKAVYRAYMDVVDFEQALPFCLKAKEMYTKLMGQDSVEVAQMRMSLGVVYASLGQNEKGLEQNQLSMRVLKKTAGTSVLLKLEQERGNMLLDLDRYEEGIEVLKYVSSHPELARDDQAAAYVSMAKAYCGQNKFSDARKYLKIAEKMFDTEDMSSTRAALAFRGMSNIYYTMKEFGTAISLLKRVLALPELPQSLLLSGSSTLLGLVSSSGGKETVKQEIPYLKDVLEKMKNKLGPKHPVLGDGYNSLGVAFLRSGELESSAEYMAHAKDILDAALGVNHLSAVKTSFILALTYAAIKRYALAKELLEKVIAVLKGLGSIEQDVLDDAVGMLKLVKEAASGKVPESEFADILHVLYCRG